MGNATVSSSGKTQAGTLHSIGGDGWDDYFQNLVGLFDGNADTAFEVIGEFRNTIRPVGGGGYAYGTTQLGQQQPAAQPHQPREGAGSPPGAPTLCPTHQQAAVWREGGIAKGSGKPYNGFWKCPVTSESISNFGGVGLKTSCPPPRQ